MRLIHHAVCQKICTESSLNLFNEKQFSSKLETKTSLKTIHVLVMEKVWVKCLVQQHFWDNTRNPGFPRRRQNQCMLTQGSITHSHCRDCQECVCFSCNMPERRLLGALQLPQCVYVCMCAFWFISLHELVDPAQETHHQLSRRATSNRSCFAYYIMYQHRMKHVDIITETPQHLCRYHKCTIRSLNACCLYSISSFSSAKCYLYGTSFFGLSRGGRLFIVFSSLLFYESLSIGNQWQKGIQIKDQKETWFFDCV